MNVLKNLLRQKYILKKFYFQYCLLTLNGKYGLLAKNFQRICQKLNQSFQQNHRRQIIFLPGELIYFFPGFKRKFLGHATIDFKQSCRNCFFRLQKKIRVRVLQKFHLFFFLILCEKFPEFLKKCLA